MRKFITPERVMFFFGAIVLIIATYLNLHAKREFVSIIPYTKYVEAVLNSLCAFICVILVIKPNLLQLQCILFVIESTITTLVGFTGIGTMIMIFLCLTLFTNGFFKTRFKLKFSIICIWWILVAMGLWPVLGLRSTLFVLALTGFYFAMFAVSYNKLKKQLSYLLPKSEVTEAINKLPPHGAELFLPDYGLTERQIKFLLLCINKGLNYETIADMHAVSVSVVKKEMAACCKAFGVKNREALRILMLQYQIKY